MQHQPPRPLPRLHLVTDARDGRDPLPDVAAALAAGVGCVQVRAKGARDRDLLAVTEAVVALAAPYDATVLVDDRADVAVAAGAHGVHVGGDDLPVPAARRVVGPGRLVGATARDPQAARAAAAAGADYLGAGPAFGTSTKDGLPPPLGVAGVAAVAAAVDVPVVAIGGVDRARAGALVRAGAHGVAVVAAVSAAADVGDAVRGLLAGVEGAPAR